MTHDERRERRKAIADDVRLGMSVSDLCTKHNVCYETVYIACKEFNQPSPSKKESKMFIVLRALLDGATPANIARSHQVSKQYASRLRAEATLAGFVFPDIDGRRTKSVNPESVNPVNENHIFLPPTEDAE